MCRDWTWLLVVGLAMLAGRSQAQQFIEQQRWPVAPGASDLELDAEGNLWLLYPKEHAVRKYYASANYDSVLTVGGRGVGGEGFAEPTQLGATGRSEVYLLDYGNQRLVLLNTNLRVSRTLDFGAEPLRTATDVAGEVYLFPKAFAVGRQGELFILNQDDNRVYKYDALGRYELAFGGTGYGAGSLPDVDALAITGENFVVALSPATQTLKLFDNFGTFRQVLRPGVPFASGVPFAAAWLLWQGQSCHLWVPGSGQLLATQTTPADVTDAVAAGDKVYVLAGDVVVLYAVVR